MLKIFAVFAVVKVIFLKLLKQIQIKIITKQSKLKLI